MQRLDETNLEEVNNVEEVTNKYHNSLFSEMTGNTIQGKTNWNRQVMMLFKMKNDKILTKRAEKLNLTGEELMQLKLPKSS